MKKFCKIIGLYILFGAVIAAVAAITGAFEGFMAIPSLGMSSFLSSMLVVVLIWLPSLVMVLLSDTVYFPFAYSKAIIAAVVIAFLLLSVRIVRKK